MALLLVPQSSYARRPGAAWAVVAAVRQLGSTRAVVVPGQGCADASRADGSQRLGSTTLNRTMGDLDESIVGVLVTLATAV